MVRHSYGVALAGLAAGFSPECALEGLSDQCSSQQQSLAAPFLLSLHLAASYIVSLSSARKRRYNENQYCDGFLNMSRVIDPENPTRNYY